MPQVNGTSPLLTNRQFLLAAGGSSVAVVFSCLFAPFSVQLTFVGLLVSFVFGIVLSQRESQPPVDADFIRQSFQIAKNEELHQHHQTLTEALARTVAHGDPLFRSLATKRVADIADEVAEISEGMLVYEDTETWRLAYEQLLRSPGLYQYRSVAFINSFAYWQDEPGRQSMRLNYEMQGKGTVTIERIAIISDDLWPANEQLPLQPIRNWLEEQHSHGIELRLVRLSAVLNEPDLQTDFGIYGSRAVGFQELSLASRTTRFVLSFDFGQVREAEDRWDRLAVYASTFRDLLEQSAYI